MSEHEKRPRTRWEQFEYVTFTYIWLVSWFVAIWYENHRWELFLTGLLCLGLGLLMASATTRPTPPADKGEQG